MKFNKELLKKENMDQESTYIRLKDGESVKGIFRGNPYEFFVVWANNKSRPPLPGETGKFRFKINFVVKEGPVYVAKIFEGSKSVYEQLANLSEEYDLENTVVKISRSGVELETTYTVLPLKDEVSDTTKEFLKNLSLNQLNPKEDELGF